ncbi:MAG: hypothetical protein FIA93_03555 [Deltaproteobacteria bacterium]|nr:hypothetical protein [Deltaproteobacteria bacterium]
MKPVTADGAVLVPRVGAGFNVTGCMVNGMGRGSTNGVLGGLWNGTPPSACAQYGLKFRDP